MSTLLCPGAAAALLLSLVPIELDTVVGPAFGDAKWVGELRVCHTTCSGIEHNSRQVIAITWLRLKFWDGTSDRASPILIYYLFLSFLF